MVFSPPVRFDAPSEGVLFWEPFWQVAVERLADDLEDAVRGCSFATHRAVASVAAARAAVLRGTGKPTRAPPPWPRCVGICEVRTASMPA